MSSEWTSGKLGDFIELKRGYDLPQAKREPGKVPLVSSSGVSDRHSVAMVKGPGVVTGRYGTIGQVFYVEEDFWPLNTTLYVRDFKGNDPQFIHYFLKTVDFLAYSDKAAVPGVNRNHLHEASVVVPPIGSQRSIAQFLGALDDRITLLRETNATLEAIAQALFKSWFVDFDPVRAKMGGRTPEGMDEATAALFPDGLETSELGEVPRGWRVGQVADLGDVVCGKTPPTSAPENYGGDVPFITIPDMHDLLAVTTTARSLSKLGADSQPKKYLPPGAICVSCIATPGLVVRVTTTAQTNQQINSVIPHRKWGSSFPLFLLRRIGDAVRSGGSGGSVFHNLSKSGFEQLPVLLTEPELADRFNAVIDPLVEKIVANQLQTQTLSTLRDTLLPRLISGQLRLPEAQAATEAALGGTLSV